MVLDGKTFWRILFLFSRAALIFAYFWGWLSRLPTGLGAPDIFSANSHLFKSAKISILCKKPKTPNWYINAYYRNIVIATANTYSSETIYLFTTLDRNSQGLTGKINEDNNFMSFPGALATFSTYSPSRDYQFQSMLLPISRKLMATILRHLSKALNLPNQSQ